MEDRYCPEHDHPHSRPSETWSRCPIAEEGDPIDAQTCHWFAAEIDLRIREVTELGNYFELLHAEEGQPRMIQEYRNHEPHGEPRQLGT